MTDKEKRIGLNYLDTFATVGNLARLHKTMGNYSQALELYRRALIGEEEKHGPDHPSTLKTVHDLYSGRRTRGNDTLLRNTQALNSRTG